MATRQNGSGDRTDGASPDSKHLLHGGKRWLIGVVVAALTAAATQAFTGAFSSLGSKITAQLRQEQPVQVATAADFVSFQRKQLDLPEYVIPKALSQIPAPPDQSKEISEREEWAAGLGGVQANFMAVQVIVEGRTTASIVLTNLTIRVVERRPPLQGTHITYGPIGEGVFERFLVVDLDSSPPKVINSVDSRFEVEGDPKNARPVRFPYKVSQSEPEAFYISVGTETCDCSWVADLHWTAGGQQGVTVIDNKGTPFRVTSSRNAPSYYSNDGANFQKVQD